MASSEKPLYHGSRSVLERARNLFRNLVIYGIGDVATSLVSLLLLPIFTQLPHARRTTASSRCC